jgi:hypothetical protein
VRAEGERRRGDGLVGEVDPRHGRSVAAQPADRPARRDAAALVQPRGARARRSDRSAGEGAGCGQGALSRIQRRQRSRRLRGNPV